MKSKKLIALVIGAVCSINSLAMVANANEVNDLMTVESDSIENNLTEGLKSYLNNKNENVKKSVGQDDIFSSLKEDENKYKNEDLVRVIVELEDNKDIKGSDEQVKSYKFAKQDNVISALSNAVQGLEVKNRYYKGVNSFSIETTYGNLSNIQEIKNLEGVKSVRLAKTYGYQMLTSDDLVNTEKVWEENKYRGEGTVVAIVDTGVDYEHKDFVLTDSGYENRKITKEEAEVNLSETEVEDVWLSEKIPVAYDWADGDSDVRNSNNEHGTHVAGIAAANGSVNGVKGVAPEAQIIVEKVFSDYGNGAYDDDIAAGIYHAVDMGADVINLSLGVDAGWVDEEDLTQAAIKYASENGVLVVAAGGNASYSTNINLDVPWLENPLADNYDIGVVGSPGISPYALQVASYENTHRVKLKGLLNSQESEEVALALFNQPLSKRFTSEIQPGSEYELVYVNEGHSSDYKDKDVEGKIVVVMPLEVYAGHQMLQYDAERKGAKGVVMVPHEKSEIDEVLRLTWNSVPLATTSTREEGLNLIERLETGENVKITMTDEVITTESGSKDAMSDFSSWGTGPKLEFKPEITAPGGNIYSTVSGNGYEEMSGTSMASPYVAGGASLVIQGLKESGKYEDENLVNLAKTILMNTSKVIDYPTTNIPYSTRKQGSGLMQLDKAVNTNALIYRKDTVAEKAAAIELKEVGSVIEFDLVLESLGNHEEVIDYSVNLDLITDKISYKEYDQDGDGTIDKANDRLDMQSILLEGAKVTINDENVTVDNPYSTSLNSGEKKEIKVKIDLTNASNLRADTFVEGFVNLESEKASDLVVPFMGFYGEWENGKNIDLPAWEAESFSPYTAVWNTIEDGPVPMGYDIYTGKWNLDKIGISSSSIFDAIAPKFTVLRNLDNVSLKVEDSEGKLIKDLGYLEDWFGNRMQIGKSIMAYRDYNLAFAEWTGLGEENNKLPDGDYKFVINSVGQYDDAEVQEREIPIKLDNTAPTMSNINLRVEGDESVVSWDVVDEGSGFDGVIIYYDDKYVSIQDSSVREVRLPSNDIKDLTILGIDTFMNISYNTYGDTKPNYDYIVNFGRVYGEEVNSESGLSVFAFSVKKADWKVSVKNLAGEEVYSYEEEYTSNFTHENITIPEEIKDGEYYAEMIVKDELGYTVTSEPHYFKVVGNGEGDKIDKARMLKATEIGSENVELTWQAPDEASQVMEYIIYKDGEEIGQVPATDELKYNVADLRSNTIYGFKVVARGKTGELSKPVSLNLRTKK